MAVIRQSNILGQQRWDVPHIRAMESSVAADFDVLAGRMMSGKQALVLKGMGLITNGAIGAQASALQVQVADASIMHFGASEAGTVFWVPDTTPAEVLSSTNPKVTGSFTASQTNYIGVDLLREADDTTSDNVQFLEGTTLKEVSKTVPLARTLGYRFVISTSDFASQPNVLPIAKVVTDANNNVSSIEDARQMFFRLGAGGDFPDRQGAYTWPGSRYENVTGDVFSGGDKSIGDLKTWMNAAMTRIWEIGGGEYWYSATADRNITLVWTGATFTNGENFEWSGTNLHWKGLRFIFDNSTGYYNDVKDQAADSAGLTDLADGDCVYVDLDRTQNLTGGTALRAVKAPLITLGSPTVPGSRYIIAWRSGTQIYTRNWRYAVGTTFTPASKTSTGVVKLNETPGDALQPTVVTIMANGVARITNVATTSVSGGAGYDAFTAIGGENTNFNNGSTGGAGGKFVGGAAPNGTGVGGPGVWGVGGVSSSAVNNGTGVRGDGADGAIGTGQAGGIGVTGNGGVGNAAGPGPGGAGGKFTGGAAGAPGGQDGWGIEAFGGGTNGGGIKAIAQGTGIAGQFAAATTSQCALKATMGYADLSRIDRAGQIDIGTLLATQVNIGSATAPVVAGNDVSVPATKNFKYASSRTFKKILTGINVTARTYPSSVPIDANGPYTQSAEVGKLASGSGTDAFSAMGQFSLPINAVITGITLRVDEDVAGGTCSFRMYKYIPAAASASPAFTTSAVHSGTGTITLAGTSTFHDYTIALTATVADRTSLTSDSFFGFEYQFAGTQANHFVALIVTYTVLEITPT